MPNVSPATVTITAPTGPGLSVTAATFTDVVEIGIDFVKNTIKIVSNNGGTTGYFAYSATATVTWTISGNHATITIS